MSAEKPTYLQRWLYVKAKMDYAMVLAVELKDSLEFEVDKMAEKKLSPARYKRCEKFVQAIDDLDRVVGHLAEADDQEVKL